jgi:predicted transcriptional regulator
MGRLTNEKLRALAERMFIEDGKTAKAIAEELEITPQTVGRWRKGKTGEKSWDVRRAELLSAPHKLKEILSKELTSIAEGNKPSIDSDALSKVSKVLESVSGKVSTQIVLSVFKEFDNWMAENDTETAILFLDWHKKFILYKASLE